MKGFPIYHKIEENNTAAAHFFSYEDFRKTEAFLCTVLLLGIFLR